MLWKQHHPYANCNFCVHCISFLLLYTSCLKRAASLLSDEENAFDPPHSLCFFLQTTPRVSLGFRSSIILVNYSFPLIFEPKNRNCSVRKRISWLRGSCALNFDTQSVSYLRQSQKREICMYVKK